MQTLSEKTPARLKNVGNIGDAAYGVFLGKLWERLDGFVAKAGVIFQTDAKGLYEAYLSGFFDGDTRQYHNCHACRHFIERYGGLVAIEDTGDTVPVFWSLDTAEPGSEAAIGAMARIVRGAKVVSPFYTTEAFLGTSPDKGWRHLRVRVPEGIRRGNRMHTAAQLMAEKREAYKTVCRALGEYDATLVATAVSLLSRDALYRSEKILGQAKFLAELHAARAGAKHVGAKRNLTWLAVAKAPEGFCHPKSSMIGTLLDDLEAGLSFDSVAARFQAKMHPLQYQRPQAPPSSGTIAQAEKIFAEMSLAAALRRRYARIGDCELLWAPRPPKEPPLAGAGIFSHLATKERQPLVRELDVPPVTMTWEKFQRTVLPTARRMAIMTPDLPQSFCVFTTACKPEAPPIVQWDRPERRNPVAWYFWHGGSRPPQFGLSAGLWHTVKAVSLQPSQWYGGDFAHHGAGVMFMIDGAMDTREGGAALFPEILRSELHPVRSVIEAHSRTLELEGKVEAKTLGAAQGVMLSRRAERWNANPIRVWGDGDMPIDYHLDRWD